MWHAVVSLDMQGLKNHPLETNLKLWRTPGNNPGAPLLSSILTGLVVQTNKINRRGITINSGAVLMVGICDNYCMNLFFVEL